MQILVRVAEDSDSRHRGAAVSRKRTVSIVANFLQPFKYADVLQLDCHLSWGCDPWSDDREGRLAPRRRGQVEDRTLVSPDLMTFAFSSVLLTVRHAGASYGVICQETWDPDVHLQQDYFFDPQQTAPKATNQMKWLVKEVREVSYGSGRLSS